MKRRDDVGRVQALAELEPEFTVFIKLLQAWLKDTAEAVKVEAQDFVAKPSIEQRDPIRAHRAPQDFFAARRFSAAARCGFTTTGVPSNPNFSRRRFTRKRSAEKWSCPFASVKAT